MAETQTPQEAQDKAPDRQAVAWLDKTKIGFIELIQGGQSIYLVKDQDGEARILTQEQYDALVNPVEDQKDRAVAAEQQKARTQADMASQFATDIKKLLGEGEKPDAENARRPLNVKEADILMEKVKSLPDGEWGTKLEGVLLDDVYYLLKQKEAGVNLKLMDSEGELPDIALSNQRDPEQHFASQIGFSEREVIPGYIGVNLANINSPDLAEALPEGVSRYAHRYGHNIAAAAATLKEKGFDLPAPADELAFVLRTEKAHMEGEGILRAAQEAKNANPSLSPESYGPATYDYFTIDERVKANTMVSDYFGKLTADGTFDETDKRKLHGIINFLSDVFKEKGDQQVSESEAKAMIEQLENIYRGGVGR